MSAWLIVWLALCVGVLLGMWMMCLLVLSRPDGECRGDGDARIE